MTIRRALTLIAFMGFLLGPIPSGAFDKQPVWTSADSSVGRFVRLVDVDGTGWKDFVLLDGGLPPIERTGRIKIYYNHNGVLESEPSWLSKAGEELSWNGFEFGDLTGDGLPEMAVSYGQNGFGLYLNQGGVLDLNAGWEVRDPNSSYRYGFDNRDLAFTDLNRDGSPDLVAGWYNWVGVYLSQNGLLPAAPDFCLTWTPEPYHPFTHVQSINAGDLERDGFPEIAVSFEASPLVGGRTGIAVYKNRQGSFAATPDWTTATGGTVAFADMDGDGSLDLASDYGWFEVHGWPIGSYHAFPYPLDATFRDCDGDGNADAAEARDYENYIYLNRNSAYGRYPDWFSGDRRKTGCLAFGDVDGDGIEDMAAANYGEGILVYQKDRAALYKGTRAFPPSGPPIILAAGWGPTHLTTAQGGIWHIWAMLSDPSGGEDVRNVEVMFQGLPTGLIIPASPAGGSYAWVENSYPVGPSNLKAEYLFILRGQDGEGWRVEPWPWLNVQ